MRVCPFFTRSHPYIIALSLSPPAHGARLDCLNLHLHKSEPPNAFLCASSASAQFERTTQNKPSALFHHPLATDCNSRLRSATVSLYCLASLSFPQLELMIELVWEGHLTCFPCPALRSRLPIKRVYTANFNIQRQLMREAAATHHQYHPPITPSPPTSHVSHQKNAISPIDDTHQSQQAMSSSHSYSSSGV